MRKRKIPLAIVKRVRCIIKKENTKNSVFPTTDSKRVYAVLGKMENVDHRKNSAISSAADTANWGGRVRQMNVSRNFSGFKVVLKRTHASNAKAIISTVKNLIKLHNKGFKPKHYSLSCLEAYSVGKNVILMETCTAPSIKEILEWNSRSKRGQKFLKENLDGSTESLRTAWNELEANLTQTVNSRNPWQYIVANNNVLVLGRDGKKFKFALLLDRY